MLSNNKIQLDDKQKEVLTILINKAEKLNYLNPNNNINKIKLSLQKIIFYKFSKLLNIIFHNKAKNLSQPQNVYLYGDVGRGKTMLMKKFFNHLKLKKEEKLLIHFNSFMFKIHNNLKVIRDNKSKKVKDELLEAVKMAVKNVKVICFDEFQVVDIADAMLLGRIFEFIFKKEIFVVFTSNSHPKDLYKNGLQRQLFLEFINKILLKKIKIIEVNNDIDYRSIFRKNIEKRYFIANIAQSRIFWNIVNKAVDSKKLTTKDLIIWGRKITINKSYDNIAIIDFKDIIEQNFGADDYRIICHNFSLIFFINLPKLNAQQINEARRLTLFIDEIYQNRVAMIILAKTKPDKLYLQGVGFESFKRTISRLKEIQSDYYWQNSKIYDSQ